jgi:AraC-like DNA-binding protein
MVCESLPEVVRRGDPVVVAGSLAGELAGVPKPCGFFYPEAAVAVSLTGELERMGVRVPEDLAALLSVCRRVLEMRFRSETGVTLHRALTDRRMALARRLLAGTPLRMGVIAERCGYSSAAYFMTAFHREAGVTPAEWRRQQPRG